MLKKTIRKMLINIAPPLVVCVIANIGYGFMFSSICNHETKRQESMENISSRLWCPNSH